MEDITNISQDMVADNPKAEPKKNISIESYQPKEDLFMHMEKEQENVGTKRRTAYSSTSSVYAEHTISDPNNDQVIYCTAAVMQAQMFDDFNNEEYSSANFPLFDLLIQLPVDFGGDRENIPEEILNHETLNDTELRELLLSKSLPTVDTIYRFFKYLMLCAGYSIECNILALVYVNRITVRHQLAITMQNWRGLWLAAIILAQKVWDDRPLKTSAFVSIIGGVNKEQLIDIEMKVFEMLDFCASVKPSVYAKYFFELHELFRDITGTNSAQYRWELQPLSISEMKRLELRSSRHRPSSRHLQTFQQKQSAESHSSSTSSLATTQESVKKPQLFSKTIEASTSFISTTSSMEKSETSSYQKLSNLKITTRSNPNHSCFEDLQVSPRARTLEDVTYSSLSRYVIN